MVAWVLGLQRFAADYLPLSPQPKIQRRKSQSGGKAANRLERTARSIERFEFSELFDHLSLSNKRSRPLPLCRRGGTYALASPMESWVGECRETSLNWFKSPRISSNRLVFHHRQSIDLHDVSTRRRCPINQKSSNSKNSSKTPQSVYFDVGGENQRWDKLNAGLIDWELEVVASDQHDEKTRMVGLGAKRLSVAIMVGFIQDA